MSERFIDRADAGRQLADWLSAERFDDPVVFALPRGGVPVAAPVAVRLGGPLDLVLVRKIGMPGQPELAAGAVVDGARPTTVWNRAIMSSTGVTEAALKDTVSAELARIEARRALYLARRTPVDPAGRSAIVVDDGIATGATMRAALTALRARGPAELVLAVPVAAEDTLAELAPLCDRSYCLRTPRPFYAVGAHYVRFEQTSDREVTEALAIVNGTEDDT